MKQPDQQSLEALADEDLMLAYQQGTAAAFDVLYARHKGGLYRYLLRQLDHQAEITNELFQDVWMKLVNARDSYRVSAKFSTYLYRIAHNRLVDHWRSHQHRAEQKSDELQEDEQVLQSHQPEPVESVQYEQNRQALKQAIANLPVDQRQTFLLKEEGNLSLLEIAEVTGVNRETVKSRLRYAVKRLQQVLQPLRSVT